MIHNSDFCVLSPDFCRDGCFLCSRILYFKVLPDSYGAGYSIDHSQAHQLPEEEPPKITDKVSLQIKVNAWQQRLKAWIDPRQKQQED